MSGITAEIDRILLLELRRGTMLVCRHNGKSATYLGRIGDSMKVMHSNGVLFYQPLGLSIYFDAGPEDRD